MDLSWLSIGHLLRACFFLAFCAFEGLGAPHLPGLIYLLEAQVRARVACSLAARPRTRRTAGCTPAAPASFVKLCLCALFFCCYDSLWPSGDSHAHRVPCGTHRAFSALPFRVLFLSLSQSLRLPPLNWQTRAAHPPATRIFPIALGDRDLFLALVFRPRARQAAAAALRQRMCCADVHRARVRIDGLLLLPFRCCPFPCVFFWCTS